MSSDPYDNSHSLNEVTVEKAELLTAIKKNRDAHRDVFLQAQAGFREAFIKELDVMLLDARAGRNFRLMVGLIEPQDHTKDYDRVIQMLEMSVKTRITLTQAEFSQYVLDDWGWKDQFVNVTSNYRQNR